MRHDIRRIAACAQAAVFALSGAVTAQALEPDQLFEKVSPSVVIVLAFDPNGRQLAQGTGVAVGPGKVVTSCRVIAKSSRVRIERGNASYGATLELPDPERDLCQLNVKDLNAPAVALRESSTIRIGQRVYAIGSPKGVELTLAEGLIAALRAGDDKNVPLLQVSVPSAAGSGGGGVFDTEGRLLGLTTLTARAPEGSGFAVPAEWVRDLPRRGAENLARMKASEAPRVAGTPSLVPQGDPSLPRRFPQAGDTWTYAAIDLRYRPRDRDKKLIYTVQSVDKASIAERATMNGNPLGEFTFSQQPIAVVRGGLLDLAPFATAFQDLKPGDTWRSVPVRVLGTGTPTVREPWIVDRVTVAGLEKVVVPAGTFDAVKVVLQGQVHKVALIATTPGSQGYVKFKETVWYAPSAKRTVKTLMEGPTFTDAYELESYRLR